MNRSGAAQRVAPAPRKPCIIRARGKRAVTHITSKYLFFQNGAASPPHADAFASGGIYGRPTIRPSPFSILLFGLSLPRWIEINYRGMGAKKPAKKAERKTPSFGFRTMGGRPSTAVILNLVVAVPLSLFFTRLFFYFFFPLTAGR